MPNSNYPHGFKLGHTSKEVPILDIQNKNGHVFWVDSNKGNAANIGNGTFNEPFATIDYAVGRCTADQGDKIFVAAGHTESVIAAAGLALDVAGITILFMGEGANRGTIDFGTAVTADMDVDAANITLVNPRFTASIDALVAPIDINAANFKIINGEYFDGTAIDTTDCVVADPNATGLKMLGWTYTPGNEAGTQKNSNIQLNGVDNAELTNIQIVGDFVVGNIENVTDEALNILLIDLYLKNTNVSPTPGIVLDVNATGYADRTNVRIASGTTYVSSVAKLNWTSTCLGYNADGEGGDPIGTADASSIEGKIDAIQTDIGDPSARINLQSLEAMMGNPDTAAETLYSPNGSILVVKKTLVSSAILIAGVDITGVSSGGDLMIEDISMNTDATGLAGGTNFQIDNDNVNGVTTLFAETVANLSANSTESLATGSVTSVIGTVLESGKKLIAKSTGLDCSGAGTITIVIKFRRVSGGATVAAAA